MEDKIRIYKQALIEAYQIDTLVEEYRKKLFLEHKTKYLKLIEECIESAKSEPKERPKSKWGRTYGDLQESEPDAEEYLNKLGKEIEGTPKFKVSESHKNSKPKGI